MSLLLIGEYEQTIDAKSRLSIPAALRDSIDPSGNGGNFVLVLGADRHLCLYPEPYYRRMLGKLKRSPLPTRQRRRLDLFFAMARMVKPDAQGRVVVPEKSMQRAVIDKQVTLVGRQDHIEIWPTDEWEKRLVEDLPHYSDMLYDAAEALGEYPDDDLPAED